MPYKDPEKQKAYNTAYNKQYYQDNGEELRKAQRDRYDSEANSIYQLRRNYGLTKAEATAAWRAKPECCEVCGRPETAEQHGRLCYEHDHDTGAFRGWVCHRCNRCMGLASDDPDVLRALAAYLEQRMGNVPHSTAVFPESP